MAFMTILFELVTVNSPSITTTINLVGGQRVKKQSENLRSDYK